jgi:formylglycine-generating enzyme required for sulfatase activity
VKAQAEWEYAARAGTTTRYSFGDDAEQLKEYAWYGGNSGYETHPVGQKKPNPWSLYDMNGNVWEWVQDWYGPYTAGAVTDPTGPLESGRRVLRGGSWIGYGRNLRSANRRGFGPGNRSDGIGFRLAQGQENQ